MSAGCAYSTPQADFTNPLHNPHKRNVCNAKGTHDQGQTAEQKKHDIQIGLYFITHAFGLQGHLNFQGARIVRT